MIESHPLLRDNPNLAASLATRLSADETFARLAGQFAELDSKVQAAAASATEQAEHASLEEQLLSVLKPAKSSGCCGGCGGTGH